LFAKEYNENEDAENVLMHDSVNIDFLVNQIDFNINDNHVNHDIDDNNNHCFHNSSGISVNKNETLGNHCSDNEVSSDNSQENLPLNMQLECETSNNIKSHY